MAARDIQLVTAEPANDQPQCQVTGNKRTLAVVDDCSAGYGADLLTLEEITP
jgi:hypothetical protein